MAAHLRISRLAQTFVRLQIDASPSTATLRARQPLARPFYSSSRWEADQSSVAESLLQNAAEPKEAIKTHETSEAQDLVGTRSSESQIAGVSESSPALEATELPYVPPSNPLLDTDSPSVSSQASPNISESQPLTQCASIQQDTLEPSLEQPRQQANNLLSKSHPIEQEDILFEIGPERFPGSLPRRLRLAKPEVAKLDEITIPINDNTITDRQTTAHVQDTSDFHDEAKVVSDILATPSLKTAPPKKKKLRHRDMPPELLHLKLQEKEKQKNSHQHTKGGSYGLKKYENRDSRKPNMPDKRPMWEIQRNALKEKFPNGWNPLKRLSPDALAGIRALHAQFPNEFSTAQLAAKFEISPEAIRRILRANWQPSAEEEAERQNRWFKRGMVVWERYAELGLKPPKKWREVGVGQQAWEEQKKAMGVQSVDEEGLADDTFSGRKQSYQRHLRNKIM
ncbi:Required for respiratory growth protein 9 mitochondrial [Ceratocystis pirilliformis]|uniref:Required for respiratory growth protein 9, mitochondrial n=1 Tax=Ceratocystis pirilliformis TaxID=259994 RepID=A0ABR3YH26_9PEZI